MYLLPVTSVTYFRLTFCLPSLGQKRPQFQDALLFDLHRFFIIFLDITFHWKRVKKLPLKLFQLEDNHY